ncbi:MAG: hypothetical protein ABEJ82_02240 [Haloplanus sp.]
MDAPTRREAVALFGSTLLAGCSGSLPFTGEDDGPELDGAALRAVVDGDAPAYPKRLPVGIEASHLDASETRARDLLGSAPARFGRDEIPNGAIRAKMQDARDRTESDLSRAGESRTAFERLDALADARADARFVAGAWRAIDADLTRADLADEATDARRALDALRERWAYVGGDPVDATLVAAAVEERLDAGHRAAADAVHGHRRYETGNPLGVGEAGESVERARTARSDAAYLSDRWRGSLDDPADRRSQLVAAHRTLAADLRAELSDLSDVDRDRPWAGLDGVDEDSLTAWALQELYRWVGPRRADRFDEVDEEALARSLLSMHETFASLWAFESVRESVADGEPYAVTSADDVAALRSAAVEALRTADDETTAPALTRRRLSSLADRMRFADDRLSEEDGSVEVTWVRRELATYVEVAAAARATPRASERVAAALRA